MTERVKKTASIAIQVGLTAWLVFGIAMVASEGCSVQARTKTLRAGLASLNVARDGFFAWDEAKQKAILDGAETHAAFDQRITEYRNRREPVVHAFEEAYRALAAAAILDSAVEAVTATDRVRAALKLWEELHGP